MYTSKYKEHDSSNVEEGVVGDAKQRVLFQIGTDLFIKLENKSECKQVKTNKMRKHNKKINNNTNKIIIIIIIIIKQNK